MTAANCNGTTAATTKAVTIPLPYKPAAIVGNATVCQGSTQTYSCAPVANTAGTAYYSWSMFGSAVITDGEGTNIITVNNITAPFTLSVTAYNCNGSTAATGKAITLPIPAKPVAIIGNATVCQGSTQTYSCAPVANTAGTAYYSWSMFGSAVITDGEGTNIITVNNITAPFTLSVTAYNCNGSTAATGKAITLPIPAKPVAIIGNATVCQGSTQTYSVAPVTKIAAVNCIGIPALDGSNRHFRYATVYDWDCCLFSAGINESPYLWLVDGHYKINFDCSGSGIIVESTGGYTSQFPVGSAYTSAFGYSSNPTYKSLITDPACCNEDGSKIYVELTDEIFQDPTIVNFNWSVSGGASIISEQGTNVVIIGNITASYTLSVTSSNCNGATAATTKSITLPMPAKPAAIIGNSTVCQGSTQTYSVAPVINTVSGSMTIYSWYVASDDSIISGQGTNVINVRWGKTPYTLGVEAANCNGPTALTTKAVTLKSCTKGEIATSVNDMKETNFSIEVYPNPNNGQFTLSMSNTNINNENVKIQVLNMIGQVIYIEVISSQNAGSLQKKNLQLSNLSAGTYFLQVLTAKEVNNKKFIILK